ncbi:alpha/beta hydrolase [Risungbinella massiliensis]|uniref:alpha/beta hydrolase n=1 Tax=Risungbinella massiliensis TaxID=1329796 RepID=UPI0005CBACC7|nr:alpha/beta hydrolase-fold protein [Risungbinella massiliensis]
METKYTKRTIRKETIESQYLQENKQILVFLPPGYDHSSTYPALFLHDGVDYFNLGRIVTQATKMIEEGQIRPLIIIGIPVNKEVRTPEYSPAGNRHTAHIQFFTRELLPKIQTSYPIDPEEIVIGGSSLGGTVSLSIALKHPEISTRVLSQSGAFVPASIEAISDESSLSAYKIYLSVGKSETAVPTHMGTLDLVARNREVSRLLKEKGAQSVFYEEEGDHTWGFWQRELPRALSYFFA